MRDFLLEIATELASAVFTRISAISARRREARRRDEFEKEIERLKDAAAEAERTADELKQRLDDAGL